MTPQVAVASTDKRIDGQHSRVVYYQECDIDQLTDGQIADMFDWSTRTHCFLAPDPAVILIANADILDIIDRMGENGMVFM